MTDRIKSLTVVLDKDIRDDDVQTTINAIYQIKNVLTVGMSIANPDDYSNRERVKRELLDKVYKLILEN